MKGLEEEPDTELVFLCVVSESQADNDRKS